MPVPNKDYKQKDEGYIDPNDTSAVENSNSSAPVDPNPYPGDPSGEESKKNAVLQEGIDYFKQEMQKRPYFNTEAFQILYNKWLANPGYTIQNKSGAEDWIADFDTWASTFSNQFNNLTGRDPNANEYNEFFHQVVLPTQPWKAAKPDYKRIADEARDLINNSFSNVAAEESERKLKERAAEAIAPGSAFDEWQKAYSSGISDVEKSLQDYQSRLFEKIRPQLLTSLQAQGLLNTGGLNEAFASANKDLSEASQSYLADARMNANKDIASAKYAIQSSPDSYALGNISSTLPYLRSVGESSLQNVWNSISADKYYQNQLALENMRQNTNKPSLLSQYGGLMLGNIAANAPGAIMDYYANK